MQIEKRKVVTIDYKLTDEEGELLDSSDDEGPLTYIHGSGSIVPGLEQALDGKVAGDAFKVSVAPAEGYGERDERLVEEVPRDRFPTGELEVGMCFELRGDSGSMLVTVVSLGADTVKLDGNHPLAGVNLNFDVTIIDVRDATLDELRHGHVHGAGGHTH